MITWILVSDKLGRSRTGSSMAPPTHPKRHSQEVFAKELASYFGERQAEYQQLVLVASSNSLGDLRTEFDDKTSRKVTAEFAKDLTRLSIHELAPHVTQLLEAKGMEHSV